MLAGKPGEVLTCTWYEVRSLPLAPQHNPSWHSWRLQRHGGKGGGGRGSASSSCDEAAGAGARGSGGSSCAERWVDVPGRALFVDLPAIAPGVSDASDQQLLRCGGALP